MTTYDPTNPQDPYHIIPRGATAARVTPWAFQVRTLVDYDVNFLQDRIVSQVFIDGQNTGVYSVAKPFDDFENPQVLLERYGADTERAVIDEFLGLGYRRRVVDLEREIKGLRERLDHVTRIRWWQFSARYQRWMIERSIKAAEEDS